jgi:peptide/nickel transport system substrate-binding protein
VLALLRLTLRRFFTAFAAFAASAILAGCSSASASRQPNTLVIVYSSDANTLNPLFANNEPAFLFYTFIFEGLTEYGPDFSVIPQLAKSWQSTPDHRHWDVDLRQHVTWSDGAPFDARDVVYTWKTMLDPQVAFPYAGQFSYVTRVAARGPYRVHFDLSGSNVLFVSQALALPILPEHILGKIPAAQQRISPFGQHPIGTGPYVLERWEHDDTVNFVRNPRWWHGRPNIERLQFRIVLNNNARVDAMVDGSADLYPSMAAADYRTLQMIAPHLTYYAAPDLFSRFIMTNDTVPGLDDVAVRQAMMYGWDRRALAEGIYHGDVILNDSLIPWALTGFHDAAVTKHPYDPARARTLLDAAGWRLGPDGIRRRGNVRLAFTLKSATGSSSLALVCAAFQADMHAIGIAIDIQQLDYATFIDQTSTSHYQMALTGWGGVPDPDQFGFLDSSQIPPVGNNDSGFRNAHVDRDLQSGLTTFDPAARRAIYDDFQRVTSETVPVLWGFDEKFTASFSTRLHINLRDALPDYYFFWNVYDWKLDP